MMARAVRVTFVLRVLLKNIPPLIFLPGGLRPHAVAGPITSEPIQLCFIGAIVCVERETYSQFNCLNGYN